MNDLDRLRNEYADRKRRFADKDSYAWFNAVNLFILQQRQRALIRALRKAGISDLSQKRILEMGCGAGGVLTEFLNFGASPRNLYGIDLLSDRLLEAREKLPASHFVNADGQRIPFTAQSFDLVMQYTALSSILDEEIRVQIAKDMTRVLKPNGVIVWYDFWLNPTNRQTHGIRPSEIRSLFPSCNFEFHKITLAPPIARKVAPVSWGLALLLENLKLFNSHYLVIISPIL
jgi:ubiquinone/menaquinone biosynthesis C-methylase UbiE